MFHNALEEEEEESDEEPITILLIPTKMFSGNDL